jgi:hypothetical protein
MEIPEQKDLTPEQEKEIVKIIRWGRIAVLGIFAKFALGIFSMNLACLLFGSYYLKDMEAETQVGFQSAAFLTNIIFMTAYLIGQFRSNSDRVNDRIKEVLKNKSE